VRREISAGRQAYVVCPLIEESEKIDVKAVTEELKRLEGVFPDLHIGLLHGRLTPAQKTEVMGAFRGGKVDILLATTVIEVGIDVPNATVMIIEDAERFGLSQLHQLRGRIGRGTHRAKCLLFADPGTDEGKARMEAIATISDGFALAEEDMRIRGEGQLFGPRQAGLPDLRVASLSEDAALLDLAREDASTIVGQDARLARPEHALLAAEVARRFGRALDWIASG
jgi:ATP-dependent DNA helicase RecG